MEMPSTRKADERRSGHDSVPLTEDLRRVLRTELLRDACSAATVARLFSMHRRTLHRHLRTEGLAFRQVANEIGREVLGNGRGRRGGGSSGGLIGSVLRGVLGGLMRGR